MDSNLYQAKEKKRKDNRARRVIEAARCISKYSRDRYDDRVFINVNPTSDYDRQNLGQNPFKTVQVSLIRTDLSKAACLRMQNIESDQLHKEQPVARSVHQN